MPVRLCLSDARSTTLTISANSRVYEFFALFSCAQKLELLGSVRSYHHASWKNVGDEVLTLGWEEAISDFFSF